MTADILDSARALINGAFFVTILYPIRGNQDTPHTFSASVLLCSARALLNSINIDFGPKNWLMDNTNMIFYHIDLLGDRHLARAF